MNTASNLATFALVHVLTGGEADWLAVVASHAVGISMAFVTQRSVVFEAAEVGRPRAHARRFVVVYATGIVVNIVLLVALKRLGLPAVVGQAIALGLIAAGTYLSHAHWTFRPADQPS